MLVFYPHGDHLEIDWILDNFVIIRHFLWINRLQERPTDKDGKELLIALVCMDAKRLDAKRLNSQPMHNTREQTGQAWLWLLMSRSTARNQAFRLFSLESVMADILLEAGFSGFQPASVTPLI